MKLVVDANEVFSFFNEKSKAREFSLSSELELYSPSFSLKEIKEHKSDVLKRFSLSETQYLLIEKLLGNVIRFADEKEYSGFLKEAKSVSPDADDTEYFALALIIGIFLGAYSSIFIASPILVWWTNRRRRP